MTNKAVRNIAPVKGGKKKTSVILLSAGQANRMKSHGPRPLVRITHELNLITHQLNVIKEALPNPEIILVCGHDGDRVMNNTPTDIIKVHNEFYETNNVVRSIGLGLRASTCDRALLIYGDLVFNYETLTNAKFDESSIFIDKSGLCSEDGVGCTFDDNDVAEQIMYDIPNKWAQIAYLTGRELYLLKTIAWNREKDRWFGFEALNEIIEKKGILKYQSPKNMKITDIDSSKDLLNIKSIL